jgi:hypothetical protein
VTVSMVARSLLESTTAVSPTRAVLMGSGGKHAVRSVVVVDGQIGGNEPSAPRKTVCASGGCRAVRRASPSPRGRRKPPATGSAPGYPATVSPRQVSARAAIPLA